MATPRLPVAYTAGGAFVHPCGVSRDHLPERVLLLQ